MAKKRANRSKTSSGGSMRKLRSGFSGMTGKKGGKKKPVTFMTVLGWGAVISLLGFLVWAIR